MKYASPEAGKRSWYRRAIRSRARIADLEALYTFTVGLSGISDTDDVIALSLEESSRLLEGRRVELLLPPGLGGARWRIEDGRLAGDAEAVAQPVGEPAGQAVSVPLGDLGTARLVIGEPAPAGGFDREDLRFLEAFAASLGTALMSCQRLDQLRSEVAAREHQARHDSLTGLGNRTMFGVCLDTALRQRRPDSCVGVMLLDLDGFKDINDTLGHDAGDAVLKEVAARLMEGIGGGRLGPGRSAARLGGDEFAFVLPEAGGVDEVQEMAGRLRQMVSHPVTVDGMTLELRASMGTSIAPTDGTDVSTLLRRADVAMYAAKTSRRGVVAYDRQIDQDARRRLVLTNELRRAMEGGQLEIWYQPVARLGSSEIVGMEALLRWRHPEYGAIEPSEFIPVAEQSGLIEPITWWVLESSLRELTEWRREGFELTMAVNVSARSLTGPDVRSRLELLLAAARIPAADLTLEITESVMMIDPDGSQRVLAELAQLGVRIAIDDFGTGYSSLSRLKRLPVHTVKIDRSFVMSMHRDEGNEAIVRATIELARNMGHQVIAEGVERQDTWDRLGVLGCDLVQGHLMAPAMPIDICRPWLSSRQAPRMAAVTPLRRAQGA